MWRIAHRLLFAALVTVTTGPALHAQNIFEFDIAATLQPLNPDAFNPCERDFRIGFGDEPATVQVNPSPNLAEADRRIEAAEQQAAEVLDLSKLNLTDVPAKVFTLARLRQLNLASNALTSLPPDIGRLERLQILQLDS